MMMLLSQVIKMSEPAEIISSLKKPIVVKEEYEDYICTNLEEDSPLDLRVNGGRSSPGARDSGTESDDMDDKLQIPEGADCKPYKKNLIKRCKCFKFMYSYSFPIRRYVG
ncbi:hypothetical protein HHI36_013511 [Cryptolaemus montrouzieri]|uniref:Uncharacterized protein n=1 Tax=Cryptolaemus montrouzieri TaxID=559131 RepID=A0ABD2NHY1_9CUCU